MDGKEYQRHPVRILLVEDNPLDARLMGLALEREKGWPTELIVASDGDEAIEVLTRASKSEASSVHLVILDLNLPRRDGTEVLQLIRSNPELRNLPVIVMSSSPEDISEDILRRVNLDASGYLMKPVDTDECLAMGSVVRHLYNTAVHGKAAHQCQ